MAKRTIIRLTSQWGQTKETFLRWEDEDGPTSEDIRDAAIALITYHWLQVGDALTVIEEG